MSFDITFVIALIVASAVLIYRIAEEVFEEDDFE